MINEDDKVPPDEDKEMVIPDGEKPRTKLRDAMSRIKERRTTALIAAVVIIGLIVGGIAVKDIYKAQKGAKDIRDNPKVAKVLNPPKAGTQNEMASSEQLMEGWQTTIERKVSSLEKQLADTQGEKEKYEKQLKAQNGYPSGKLPLPPVPFSTTQKPQAQGMLTPLLTNPNQPTLTPPKVAQTPGKPTNAGVPNQAQPTRSGGTFRTIDFSATEEKGGEGAKATAAMDVKNIDLPMGIAVGLTINGMDAPTFAQGQQDPQPLLVSIETSLVTANNKEIDIKGCMVLASAHGSVSAEKAMPRLVRMNCRDAEGNLYSGSVKGWVLGDDGKVGITGRLVSRQGAVLAKSFWADIISLGGTFLRKAADTTTSYSALGYIESSNTNPADLAKQAAGSAVERTTDRIAKFFIKIAEQIYPVIEIMPGRKVTMMVESGSLKKVDNDNFAALTGLGSASSGSTTKTAANTAVLTKKEDSKK